MIKYLACGLGLPEGNILPRNCKLGSPELAFLQGFLKVIALNTLSADDADPAQHWDDPAADFTNNFL